MGLRTLIEPASEPVSAAQLAQFLRVDQNADADMIAALGLSARRWCEEYTKRRFISQTVRLTLDFFPGFIDSRITGSNFATPLIGGSTALLAGIRYAIILPFPPVSSVVQLAYIDVEGNPQTLNPATQYEQDLVSQPARLAPTFGQVWPVARVVTNAVTVDFVAGYGGNATFSLGVGPGAVTSGYTFLPTDVGRPITVGAVSTTVATVDAGSNATLAAPLTVPFVNGAAYLGAPVPPNICTAILFLARYWYDLGNVEAASIPDVVQSLLSPYRDLRI